MIGIGGRKEGKGKETQKEEKKETQHGEQKAKVHFVKGRVDLSKQTQDPPLEESIFFEAFSSAHLFIVL